MNKSKKRRKEKLARWHKKQDKIVSQFFEGQSLNTPWQPPAIGQWAVGPPPELSGLNFMGAPVMVAPDPELVEQMNRLQEQAKMLNENMPSFGEWMMGSRGRAFVGKLAGQRKPGALLLLQMLAPSDNDYSEQKRAFDDMVTNQGHDNIESWAKEECVQIWLAALKAEETDDLDRAQKLFATVPDVWRDEVGTEARKRRYA